MARVLPIDEVAQAAGTVGYELMCALAPRGGRKQRPPASNRFASLAKTAPKWPRWRDRGQRRCAHPTGHR
jgi:hypothetical protein